MHGLSLSLGVTGAAVLFAAACDDATTPDPAAAPELAVGAGAFECTGPATGSFDNIVVPRGAFCTLSNSTATGSIRALEGSTLFIINSTIGGDVEGAKANNVELVAINGARNLVGGSIRVSGGGEGVLVCGTDLSTGDIEVERMTGFLPGNGFVHVGGSICDGGFGGGNTLTKGSIRVRKNTIPANSIGLEIVGNSVAGDLQVLKNQGPNTKLVQGNTVGGALECFDNAAPFVGGPNTPGTATGQCF
jgi:hypothetical protein